MNSKQHVRLLHIQLLCISRLSQRALDYAIKGYQLGNADFCGQVRAVDHKFREHHRQIQYLCHELTADGVTIPSDFRFALAALRVDCALQRTYEAATRIAQDTLLLIERSAMARCAPLDRFGRLVNSLMRLCTVALFEKEECYAEMVLQSHGLLRRCELIFDHSSRDVGQRSVHSYVLAITQSLSVIAKQAHEMAAAIHCWLNYQETVPTIDASGFDLLNFPSQSGDCRNAMYQSLPDAG